MSTYDFSTIKSASFNGTSLKEIKLNSSIVWRKTSGQGMAVWLFDNSITDILNSHISGINPVYSPSGKMVPFSQIPSGSLYETQTGAIYMDGDENGTNVYVAVPAYGYEEPIITGPGEYQKAQDRLPSTYMNGAPNNGQVAIFNSLTGTPSSLMNEQHLGSNRTFFLSIGLSNDITPLANNDGSNPICTINAMPIVKVATVQDGKLVPLGGIVGETAVITITGHLWDVYGYSITSKWNSYNITVYPDRIHNTGITSAVSEYTVSFNDYKFKSCGIYGIPTNCYLTRTEAV